MNLIKLLKGKFNKISFIKNENSFKNIIKDIKVEYRKVLFHTVINIHTSVIGNFLFKTFMLGLMFTSVYGIGYIWRTVQSEFYLPYEVNTDAKYHNVETFKNVNDYNRMKLSIELTKYY